MVKQMNGFLLIGAGVLLAQPVQAQVQGAVQVQLYWEWGDGGWRAHRSAHAPRAVYGIADVYPGEVLFRAPPRALRVPPGHLPPPGSCRLWYPGRPTGHQPPPGPCGPLFRAYRQPGVVILGQPAFRDAYGGPYNENERGGGKDAKKRGGRGS